MNDVYLDHLAYALGERRCSVDETVAAGRASSTPSALREAGFVNHHVCAEQTTAYDLAKRTIETMGADLGRVGAIIYATCLPLNASIGSEQRFRETHDVKHLMDFPASHLQADFGLDGALVIGLSQQACTGMLGSLRLARALLHAEPEVGDVLCLTADRFPHGAHYEQAYNVISDGAAACVVSRVPRGFRLIACHSITNGALAHASDDETVGSYFTYTRRVIEETLQKARLRIPDITWIVPQNVNVKAWQILARLLGVEPCRVYCESIADVAHVISGDNVINLRRLCDSGQIQPGHRVLLCMAGYGLNWQCVILEKAREQ